MRTVGIDLSSQPANTAVCVIEWRKDSAQVLYLKPDVTDEAILDLVACLRNETQDEGDWAIGIDAPFGWPIPFIDFITRSPRAEDRLPAWDPERRDELYLRQTDHLVIARGGPRPLSVVADRIALAAIRCAGLLDALGVVDRSGGDCGVFEVYPAAALNAWELTHKRYKPRNGKDVVAFAALQALFCQVCTKSKLEFSDETASLCARNADAFDALIAALVARAAVLGYTIRPNDGEMCRARTEGWIAIPKKGCTLGSLVMGGPEN